MLDVLRRNASSWVIKAILLFIALTFIWWGVGTWSEEDRNVAATIGKERITMGELAEAAANLEKRYREVLGSAFTPEMAKELKQQALNSLIQRRILLSEARTLGISATDEEVQREIAATPGFQVNGQFREERYRQLLVSNRLTPAEYETSTRTGITIRKLEGVLAAGALVPETEAKDLFLLSTRKIRLLVATADPDRMTSVAAPTEGEIAAKYEQAKESYRVPARVKIAVAAFSAERFARDVRPSEEEVKAYHEGNADRFRSEEQRLVSRIVLPYSPKNKEAARKKALEAAVEAAKGRDRFEAAARKLSAGKPGETWVTRKEAGPELSQVLFSAPVDTVVGPVDVKGAYVLARVDRIRFPETLPLAQVRDRVVEQISLEKGKDLATIKAYEAQPKAASAKDVGKTAAEYGVKASETGWIGAAGAPGVPAAVAQDALLLSAGEVGPVKTLGDTHYLYQVLSKEDSRIPPLPDVRAQVVAEVAREKRAAAARAALQQAISGSRSAEELEANARKAGMTTLATGWFAPLADPIPGNLSQTGETRKDISLLSPREQVSRKIYPGPEGRFLAVAFLEERASGDAEWAGKKDSFLPGMRQQEKSALVEAYLADRSKQMKVDIHPDALK
ncbi:MAG: PpiC-type peptidyl-prolyl cis-trans isomerase [Deltaproteobacteria bacterium]|nr:PpiC-type peptidyl-prolyl cis-trans isomerase [Deltaproteobacteria bacterium]